MKNMKLFAILSTLTKEDLRNIKKCVQSPIFNHKKEVEVLFGLLRKSYPSFPSTIQFRQQIFKKIYPDQSFNEKKFNKLTFDLLEVIHQYFLYRHTQQNKIEREVIIAKAYHQQNLPALHTKKNLQILEQINDYPLLDAALMHYKVSILWRLIFENQYTHENVESYLYELIDTLNQQYLHQKYLAEIDIEVLKGRINFKKDLSFFSEEGIINIEELSKNIQIFKKIKQLMKEKENILFIDIQAIFFNISNQLTVANRQVIFGHLVSFLIREVNLGKQEYISTVFNLYKYGLLQKIIISQTDKISAGIFQNIVSFAIMNKAFIWGEQFVEDYYKKIEGGNIDEVKNINVISLLLYRGEYQNAIEYSLDKKFSSIHPNLTLKGITVRSYFELFLQDKNYYQPFNYNSLTFANFLKRKDIPIPKKNRYENLLKFMMDIAKSIHRKKDFQPYLKQWKQDITRDRPIALKTWVLEKITSLEDK